MFLSKQEAVAVSVLIGMLFIGGIGTLISRKYPFLNNYINRMDSDKLFIKVDINTATKQELMAVPYIGEYSAQKILSYRENQGPFDSVEQLLNISGIYRTNYEKFKDYLIIRKK